MNPADYGLTDDTVAAVETIGAANTPEPKRKPRVTTLDTARAALEAKLPIPFIRIGSAENPAAIDKAWKLWGLYAGTDYDGLMSWSMNGNNTYAKLLRAYQDVLLASLADGIEAPGDMINDLQVAWDAELAAKVADKAAARALRKAEKGTAAAVAKKAASAYDFSTVETSELNDQATALEKLISDERKTVDAETQTERRARAKAMRAELSSRLTPEDRAANAAATKLLAKAVAKPKPTPKAGDADLIARGTKPPVEGAKMAPAPEPKAPKAAKPKAEPKTKPAANGDAVPKIDVFSSVTGARTAARKALGDDAVEGTDFKITGKGKRLSWIPIGTNAPKA